MLRYFVVLAFATVGCFALTQQPSAKSNSQQLTPVKFVLDDEGTPEETAAAKEYSDLQKEFKSAMAELKAEIAKVDSKQAKAEILVTKNPTSEFAKRHMAHAKKHVGTKASLNSVLFAVGVTRGDQKHNAMKFLIENYADRVRLDKIASSLKDEVPSQDIENWYQLMIKKAKKDSVKVSVMYDLSLIHI